MADDKKSKPKPAEFQSDSKTIGDIITILAILIVLGAVSTAILNFIDSLGLGAAIGLWDRFVAYFLANIWPMWKFVAVAITMFAILGIVNNSRKLGAIEREEQMIFNPASQAIVGDGEVEGAVEPKQNSRWDKIMALTNSENSSDWQMAIIEADVMLEELLDNLGYRGDSVGEILKTIDKSDFLNIEDAWEAHKVRNNIAHSGGKFQLNQREAKRVIALFENVFREFQVV